MTRDDVIRMAREAGLVMYDYDHPSLERFAALVAAAEREKLAQWMIEHGYATGHGDTTEDLLTELDWQADERIIKTAAAERERFCSDLRGLHDVHSLQSVSTIRSRGQTTQQRVSEALDELQADGTLSPAEHRRLVNRPWSSP
jgi:hypothetical protein